MYEKTYSKVLSAAYGGQTARLVLGDFLNQLGVSPAFLHRRVVYETQLGTYTAAPLKGARSGGRPVRWAPATAKPGADGGVRPRKIRHSCYARRLVRRT